MPKNLSEKMAQSQSYFVILIFLFINYNTAVTIPSKTTNNHHHSSRLVATTNTPISSTHHETATLYENLNETEEIDVMSILIPPATVEPDIQLLKKEDAQQ